MRMFFWNYSASFALGAIIPFNILDWKFWVVVIFGNILIFARDNAIITEKLK